MKYQIQIHDILGNIWESVVYETMEEMENEDIVFQRGGRIQGITGNWFMVKPDQVVAVEYVEVE